MVRRYSLFVLGVILGLAACGPRDTTPPGVLSVSPADGATEVAARSVVAITFSEAMDPQATEGAFSLTGASAVAGAFTWDSDGAVLTFTPSTALDPAESYTVAVSVDATDAAGNALLVPFGSAFVVAAQEAPAVLSVVPEDATTEVAADSAVVVTFSEAMDTAATEAAFALTGASVVAGSASWNDDRTILTFAPQDLLTFYAGYGVTVGTSATDLAGNALASAFSSGFETGAPTGELDLGFGTSGTGVVEYDSGVDEYGHAVVVDSAGRIVVAGSLGSTNVGMALWRYNTDGTLDTSFGAGGVAVHNGAAGTDDVDEGHAVCLDASGRILVTGTSNNGASDDMVIWRYTSSGVLDTSFGTGGVVVSDGVKAADGNECGDAIAIDASGGILVAGFANSGGTAAPDMALWRYDADGDPDAEFGDGSALVDGAVLGTDGTGDLTSSETAHAVAPDGSGRIVVVGQSVTEADGAMVVWTYTAAGNPYADFGTEGVAVFSDAAGGGGGDNGVAMAIDGAGRILVAGQGRNAAADLDVVVWRLLADGSLDTSFGTSGVYVIGNAFGVSGAFDLAAGVGIDAAGAIMLTGYSPDAEGHQVMFLRRLDEDGAEDVAFTADAWASHRAGAGAADLADDFPGALAFDSRGGTVVVAFRGGDDCNMAIWRHR